MERGNTWGAVTGVAIDSLLARPTILTGEGKTVARDTNAVFTVET